MTLKVDTLKIQAQQQQKTVLHLEIVVAKSICCVSKFFISFTNPKPINAITH